MKKIKINPKNKGKFNATKKATGKTTEELTHSKNPVTKKRAIFAQNAAKWNKKDDGGIQNPWDYQPNIQQPTYTPPQDLQQLNVQMPDYQVANNPLITPTAPILYENETQLKDFIPYDNSKPKVNLKQFGITPMTGNKYLNRGLQYLNQSIKHGQNINNPNPNMSADYNGMQSLFKNGGLMKYDNGGNPLFNPNYYDFSQEMSPIEMNRMEQTSIQSINPTTGLGDIQTLPNQQTRPQFNQSNLMQGLATGVNAIQSGINFGKGTLDIIGSQRQNQQAQKLENQLYSQSVFSQGLDTRPEDYIFNRNALAEHGKQIKEIGGQGMPNIEVEDKEAIMLPNGFSQEISGLKHSEGGIPLSLPTGTKIFSEKLKVETPKGKKSYADLAKPFETKKNVDLLEDKKGDDIQKKTAEMMIKFKTNKLEELFNQQEMDKIQGKHGVKVKNEAMNEYGIMKNGGKIRQAVNGIKIKEGEEILGKDDGDGRTKYKYENGTWKAISYVPNSGNGEMRLSKAQQKLDAGQIKEVTNYYNSQNPALPTPGYGKKGTWQGDINPSIYPVIDPKVGKPEAYSNYWNAMTDYESLDDYAKAVGYTGNIDYKNPKKTSLEIQKFVGQKYPDLVKKYHDKFGQPNAGTPYDSKLGRRWGEIAKEIQALNKPTLQTSNQQLPVNPVTNTVFKDRYIQTGRPDVNIDGINLGIPLPNVYGRTPLNYYKTSPNYIDPRYLNIQPQLNQVTKTQRALQNNLGSRGTGDISNLLQSQANAYDQNQQIFGQKYNYDQSQDAQTQQFNAQAKTQNDQFNQSTWFNQLENPIRMREAAISDQMLTDDYRGQERFDQSVAFNNNKNFIDKTYSQFQNMTPEQIAAYISASNPTSYKNYIQDDGTYTEVRNADGSIKSTTKKTKYKNGGKLKISPKIKKK